MTTLKSGKVKFSKADEGKVFRLRFGSIQWNKPGFKSYFNGKRITSSYCDAFWTEGGEYHKGYNLIIDVKILSYEKYKTHEDRFKKGAA